MRRRRWRPLQRLLGRERMQRDGLRRKGRVRARVRGPGGRATRAPCAPLPAPHTAPATSQRRSQKQRQRRRQRLRCLPEEAQRPFRRRRHGRRAVFLSPRWLSSSWSSSSAASLRRTRRAEQAPALLHLLLLRRRHCLLVPACVCGAAAAADAAVVFAAAGFVLWRGSPAPSRGAAGGAQRLGRFRAARASRWRRRARLPRARARPRDAAKRAAAQSRGARAPHRPSPETRRTTARSHPRC